MNFLGINSIFEDLRGWDIGDYIYGFFAIGIMTGLSLYWKDTPIGIISSLSNIMCVLLVARGKISNYFWGTLGVILYGYIAYQNKYFGDAMLNFIYYFPMQFIGCYLWSKKQGKDNEFRELSIKGKLATGVLSAIAIFGYGLFLNHLGGSLPYVDATSTVLSVVAMLLMANGYIDQWLLWIVVNTVSIIMWAVVFINGGENIATLIMWCVFWVNSLYGYFSWRKMIAK